VAEAEPSAIKRMSDDAAIKQTPNKQQRRKAI
jgi:hypothetical protein